MSERFSYQPEQQNQPENGFNAEILPRPLKHAIAESKMNAQLRFIRQNISNL